MLHKNWLSLSIALLMVSLFAGCGGGSGSTAVVTTPPSTTSSTSSSGSTGSTPAPSGPVSLATKASDYSGTWTGTYQTNVIASQPFTLYLDPTSATTTAASGTFASKSLSGTVSGTYNSSTGNLDFILTPASGSTGNFTGKLTKTSAGLSLGTLTGLSTYGNSTTGSGSCTAPAAATVGTVNLSGVWTGTAKGGVIFGTQDPTDTVTAIVADDGAGGYAGVLTTVNHTIYGNFTMEKISGHWFAFLSQPDPSNPGHTLINMTTQTGFDISQPNINGDPVDILNMTITGFKAGTGSTNSSQYNIVIHNYDISKALAGNWTSVSAGISGYTLITGETLNLTTTDNTNFSGSIALTLTNADGTTNVTTAPVSGVYTPAMQITGSPFTLTVGSPTVTGTGAGLSNLSVTVNNANKTPRIAEVKIGYQYPGASVGTSSIYYLSAQ